MLLNFYFYKISFEKGHLSAIYFGKLGFEIESSMNNLLDYYKCHSLALHKSLNYKNEFSAGVIFKVETIWSLNPAMISIFCVAARIKK